MNRWLGWSGHLGRRIVRAGLAPAALVGALAGLGLLGPAAGALQEDDAPAASEETLTWSVRPTPTESEPERPNFSYDVEPGATVQDSIRVRNYGDQPLPLAIYASDAMVTTTGALDLLPAGEQPTGVGTWIMVAEVNIEVPAQDFVDVPFTMVVPGGTESGDHSGGIVTSIRSAGAADDGQPVVLDRRLGSRMHVRVGGDLHPELEISDLSVRYSGTLNPAGTGTAQVTYTVTNTGNVRVAAEQLVKVPGRFGLPGREAELDPMPELLPSSSLQLTAEVPDVWPTVRTDATVELELVPVREDDEFDPDLGPASATKGTWSVPWIQLVILLVVVSVPLWVLRRRRQRRQREATATQQATQTAALVQDAVQAVLAHRDAGASAGTNGNDDRVEKATSGDAPEPDDVEGEDDAERDDVGASADHADSEAAEVLDVGASTGVGYSGGGEAVEVDEHDGMTAEASDKLS